MPSLSIKVFTTDYDPRESPFSWDTARIPFIIDNSATAIISNVRKLFTASLVPTTVTLETAEGISTETKLVGSIRLVLTDNTNQNHAPGAHDQTCRIWAHAHEAALPAIIHVSQLQDPYRDG